MLIIWTPLDDTDVAGVSGMASEVALEPSGSPSNEWGPLMAEGSPDNGRGFSEPRFPPMNPGNSDGPVKPRVRCMDVNLYATKKSIAQGMMDIALLTANASQLKHLLHEGPEVNRFFGLTVACVALSIALQVLVGVLLIFNGRYNINKTHQQRRAETLNNLVIIGVFLITVINIFVSAFSGPDTPRWVSEKSRIP